eukprot:CAMPEP_0195519564 /NCGR_PEP_ID=MMETSP0794_2-20130614/15066_1 /TAXON_ID=515487 /ORGANISM="Stephanopyxis turris, Strain CCMP 815" /LENGTH=249 /DNA_ID=CAMNT_0040648743 /DNA_START=49 /DNA_END=798 /DNA_ORIENTATION=-
MMRSLLRRGFQHDLTRSFSSTSPFLTNISAIITPSSSCILSFYENQHNLNDNITKNSLNLKSLPQLITTRNFGASKRYKGKGKYTGKKREKTKSPIPPIINGVPREERLREAREFDKASSVEMQQKMQLQEDLLRFDFTALKDQMSDRVKKLFDLTNGNQREVVKAQKERGMKLFQKREGDTGSSAVQIIALTTRIQQLQTHMATHRKDYSTKRGLDALYVRRRKMLDYLERKDFDSYRKVVKTLGLVR